MDDGSRYRSNHISSINGTLDPMVGQEMPCHHVPCLDCNEGGTKSERTRLFGDRHVRSGLDGEEYGREGDKDHRGTVGMHGAVNGKEWA